jgi:flagellar protein FliL
MATAAAAEAKDDVVDEHAIAPHKSKKKLIVLLAVILVVALLGGGGAAVFAMKKKAAAAAAAEEEAEADPEVAAAAERRKARQLPTFVPLEPFVVNLADKDTDRYAQVGITLEVDDPKFAEELKVYMPAIRNGILMVLAHKTSQQLLQREGKVALAREIMREAVLPLGIRASTEEANSGAAEEPQEKEGDEDEDEEDKPQKKKKAAVRNPVTRVHFSNFIVQ